MERRRRPRETEAKRAEERSSLGGQSDDFNRPSRTAPKNNNWRTGPTDITLCGPSLDREALTPLEVKLETGNEEEEVQSQ